MLLHSTPLHHYSTPLHHYSTWTQTPSPSHHHQISINTYLYVSSILHLTHSSLNTSYLHYTYIPRLLLIWVSACKAEMSLSITCRGNHSSKSIPRRGGDVKEMEGGGGGGGGGGGIVWKKSIRTEFFYVDMKRSESVPWMRLIVCVEVSLKRRNWGDDISLIDRFFFFKCSLFLSLALHLLLLPFLCMSSAGVL